MEYTLFDGLITSKMRVRLLMRLFLNASSQAYLRELASEFGASPGQLRKELGNLSQAGLLEGEKNGRQIYYRANRNHPLFPELQSMVRKALGMDHILDSIVHRLGDLEQAWLLDDYAEGKDTGIIDLLLVGNIHHEHLDELIRKTEKHIKRKIRILIFHPHEFKKKRMLLNRRPKLLLWKNEYAK